MTYAYLVFPDVVLDCLDKEETGNTKNSRIFLSQLLKEKIKCCTLDSKKYRGFIADYHWKGLLDIILELINKDNISKEEINIIQFVLESLDREGIEDYPYQENYTPILDLAKDKSDTYDIVIVCNNIQVKNKIKEFMQQPHFNGYQVINSEEAFYHILNN